jgi:hypothetical protein
MREIEERIRTRLLAMESDVGRMRNRARRLTVGLVVALALAAIVAVNPDLLAVRGVHAGGEVLEVQRLVLKDSRGIVRGEWKVDEEGSSRLGLLDSQGRLRLSLSVLGGGFPGLSLINAEGQRRAALGLLPDGTTSMVFADAGGVPRAVLGLTRGEAAHLVFADADGASLVALGLDAAGDGTMILPADSAARRP